MHESDPYKPLEIELPVPLEAVLCTDQLLSRAARSADYRRENEALTRLAQSLADSSGGPLRSLVEVVREVCHAGSAGVSLLRPDGEHFHWDAIAGAWAKYAGSDMPRSSPCGTVLERDCVLLFARPERHFRYDKGADPPIIEALLVPFYVKGEPRGTLWVISHDERRRFDQEDARLLASLSGFAAGAYRLASELEECRARSAEASRSRDLLQRANQHLLEFTSIASHDLQEPLRGIALLASFVQEDEHALAAASRTKLDRIGSLAVALSDMVKGLIEYARTGLEARPEPCDLQALVGRVLDRSRESLAQKNALVELRGPLPTVLADCTLMERVFSNLISNAVKFNESPQKRVEIFAEGGAVAVRDNGIGIDPRHQERIFRLFGRAHPRERFAGEGLGLAFAKRVVEIHGGTLTVESQPGSGTTFRISLPLATGARG